MKESRDAEEILLAWSGGKESALSFYRIKKLKEYEIVALITTLTKEYERISMHGVRLSLLEKQAESLGCGLERVYISKNASNEEYDEKMKIVLKRYKGRGIKSVAFGDIFLEDVRRYREENLSKIGMKGLFPLWGENTFKLAKEFIECGFKAIVTSVDSSFLDSSFVGRKYDFQFLADLPSKVDPCGENGEFHSFVYDGPIFRKRVNFEVGEVVKRDGFFFCDLLPDFS
jgi:uncharacterized protein (TIGR00290 family)